MAKSCVCVNCGFSHEPETGKKTSKQRKCKENPFATRGREEFSALVAKVEEKKQKILKRSETDNALMVRFVHSDDNKLKPVIVRAKSDIRQKSRSQDAASPTFVEVSAAETTHQIQKVKLERLQLQQRFHDNLVAAVILASLLLIFLEVLWHLTEAKN